MDVFWKSLLVLVGCRAMVVQGGTEVNSGPPRTPGLTGNVTATWKLHTSFLLTNERGHKQTSKQTNRWTQTTKNFLAVACQPHTLILLVNKQ